MSNVVVTGGSGFIGSNLIAALAQHHANFNIINLDVETYAARPPIYSGPKVLHHKIDIRDQAAVRTVMEYHKPSFVFHLAAESHVCRSIAGPKDFITTNVLGTFNVLEEFRRHGSGTFVHVSTDEVYGEADGDEEFDEQSPYRPRSPYAASKAASDLLAEAWHETYGITVAKINMCNVFGPNQHPEKLIPMTITKILEQKDVIIHGDGTHSREWMYVGNAVDGIIKASQFMRNNEAYAPGIAKFTLGTGVRLENMAMVNMIHRMVREALPELNLPLNMKLTDDRPTDDKGYAVDSSNAIKSLAWDSGAGAFQAHLNNTVRWYISAMMDGEGVAKHGSEAMA